MTLMSFVCFNINAQQVETMTARFGEVVNVKKQKDNNSFTRDAGIFTRIGLGGSLLVEKKDGDKHMSLSAAGWNATAVVGYQYTQKVSFGAGIGYYMQFANYSQNYYAYNNDVHMKGNSITSLPINSLPIFLNARIHLSEGSCRPFFDIKLGYMIGLNRAVTDCQRIFTKTGVIHEEGTGDNYWYGVYDEWNQYDTYSKMQGFYGVLAFGLSFNNFDLGLEISPITWKQDFEKVYHKEFRKNGLPDWEYAQTLGKYTETKELSGDSGKKRYFQFGLKIAYTIPIKKAN